MMKKLLSTVFAVTFAINAISPTSFAQNGEPLHFEMINSLTVDERRSLVPLPDITITWNQDIEHGRTMTIIIPTAVQGIISSDMKSVMLGGNAAFKMETPQLEHLSLNQRRFTLHEKVPLQKGDVVILYGLNFKAYSTDNTPQAIQLEVDIQGQKKTFNTDSTIRLDSNNLRRRSAYPDPVREIKLNAISESSAKLRWSAAADLDIQGYFVSVNIPSQGRIIDKEFTTLTSREIEGLIGGQQVDVTISSFNNAGLSVDKTVSLQVQDMVVEEPTPEPEAPQDPEMEPEKNFGVLYSEVVPYHKRTDNLILTDKVERNEAFQLIRDSNVYTDLSDAGRLYIDRLLERMQDRTGQLSQDELGRMMVILSRRERLRPVREVEIRSDVDSMSYAERTSYRYQVILTRVGIINEDQTFNKAMNASFEEFYRMLEKLWTRVKGE